MNELLIPQGDICSIALGTVLIAAQALELYVMFGPVGDIRGREKGPILNQHHRSK